MHTTLVRGTRGNRIWLQAGTETLQAMQRTGRVRLGLLPMTARASAYRPGELYVQPLRGRLSIPGSWRLHVEIDDGLVRMGPVIGIFTSSRRKASRRPFAGLTERFRRFIMLAREMGAIAYVFTPKGIQWETKIIRGYTYLPRGKTARWVKGVFPFPDVVYNRVPTRKAERRKSVREARLRLLAEPGLNLFNPEFLDKWSVYQILSKDETLKAYLPATLPCTGAAELLPFLRQHGRIYLKMADGSLGKGTVRVELLEKGGYKWHATRPGGHMVHRTLRKEAELRAMLARLRKRRRYLMQQAVALLKSGGRPFDIRALVQKDSQGNWQVTGMAARIAGRGQITTHRPRGGSRARLAPLIRSIFRDEAKARRITQELHRVIVRAAEVFDGATGNRHGELSMDVGLDAAGHPWIFELNSKPAIFDEPSIRRVARKRLLNYCFTRSGFASKASGIGG